MNLKAPRIVKNVYVFAVLSKIMMVAIGFLYTILLARYLGSALKGQLAQINTITAITVIVCSFGIHQAYPYYRKQDVQGIRQSFVHVSVIVFFILTVLSAVIVAAMGSVDRKVMIAVLLTPLLTFTKLVTYQVMVDEPNVKNAWELIIEIIEVAALIILLLFFKRSLELCLLVIVGKNVLAAVYYLRREKLDFHFSKSDIVLLKKCVGFGFFPMLALLMNNLNYRIDILMLSNAVSDEQIGIYSVGIQIAEKVWLISDALRDVLFSKLVKGKDTEEVNKVIRVCITVSAFIDGCIIILGKPFIRICYGIEYVDAYYPLVIVLFGTLIMVFYKIIQAYNIVHKKQKINTMLLGISVVTNIVLNTLLIPYYGITGAAFASLVSYSVCAVLFVAEYTRATGTRLMSLLFIRKQDVVMLRNAVGGKKTKRIAE